VRLMRYVIIILCLSLLFIALAFLSGRVQPVPPQVAALHLDVCAPPCWIGITPGVTTLEEAKQRIAEFYPAVEYTTSQSRFLSVSQVDLPLSFSIELDPADSLVVYRIAITLNSALMADGWTPVDNPPVTWADLDAAWGNPRYIAILSCQGFWLPAYGGASSSEILIAPSEGFPDEDSRADWNNRVVEIRLNTPFSETPMSNQRPWRGFLRYQQYNDNEYPLGLCGE